MKTAVLSFVAVIFVQFAAAQYKPVDNGSSIEYNVKHFGIKTSGSFSGLQGHIEFNRNSLNDSKFDVSIDASSVRSGAEMRDDHLRGEDFLDSKKYPRIHFVSSKITPSEKGEELVVSGQLTIRNHTKDVTFSFMATQTEAGYIFKGSFVISRKDFEVGSSGVISDSVEVALSISAVK